jgi:hypothetical protein
MNQFMRAHGYLPGPTQRPVLAGVLTGTAAVVPALFTAWQFGAIASVAARLTASQLLIAAVAAALAAVAGAVYGRLFMRAANDRRGGWLFGISFGFLLWMTGAVVLSYGASNQPVATGRAGQILFASHLLYGLALGATFPHVHRMVHRRAWTAEPW